MVRVVALAALLLAVTGTAASAAPARVPPGWLGVAVDGPMTPNRTRYDGEWDRIAAAGAESVRVAFYWDAMQPHERFEHLPRGDRGWFRSGRGVPTLFLETDALVGAAARRGLKVLPVVQRAPHWAALRPSAVEHSPPRDAVAYAAFLRVLVERYGPRGSFWRQHPELTKIPIRDWQIWNEPNVPLFWSEQPFAQEYVSVLQHAHRALRLADPGSRTILAGLTLDSTSALRAIYSAGGKYAFDVIAVHPVLRRAGVRGADPALDPEGGAGGRRPTPADLDHRGVLAGLRRAADGGLADPAVVAGVHDDRGGTGQPARRRARAARRPASGPPAAARVLVHVDVRRDGPSVELELLRPASCARRRGGEHAGLAGVRPRGAPPLRLPAAARPWPVRSAAPARRSGRRQVLTPVAGSSATRAG
jgi:hypothetical protein